ncbi:MULTISPECIES: spore coat U domain-containing protein [Enterobacteriaceae]|uniref:Spore coat U domain-containing protein n=1 Tax=Raoultella lignicola TaxID=3040939 RepID=A0ABU9FCE5_9ENTR|nr:MULTISPECIES: spore coat U domain-containing protein [Enterobacteriaceae]MRT50679.1 fimbrial major subunit CsuA/B family protein [Raoultella sp. RIT712]QNK08431.1 spore coat U domain-containing protein [Enterobacter sp. JUb54]ROS16361.1 spore coat protein U-like protein [Raoultella sp. BIGb0399]
MNVKTMTGSVLSGLFGAIVVTQSAFALPLETGTLTGQVGVQLTIGDGCTVKNGTSATGTNSWGTIDFGSYSDLVNAIDADMLGSSGANAVSVTCSDGLNSTLTLNGGEHSGSGTVRRLENADGDQIPYRLYSDSSRLTEVTPDGEIAIVGTGIAQNIPIYARILPVDQGAVTAPSPGLYQDMVIATLTW